MSTPSTDYVPPPRGNFRLNYICPQCGPFSVYHTHPDYRNVWCQWCRRVVKVAPADQQGKLEDEDGTGVPENRVDTPAPTDIQSPPS